MPSDDEVVLRRRIDEIYTRWPFYGSRRITVELRRDGLDVGRDRVRSTMREMGIEGIHPGPNLSKRAREHKIYPYLLRNITAQYPHHIWGIDITYIRMPHGWMYLVAIIDWYSRYVVSCLQNLLRWDPPNCLDGIHPIAWMGSTQLSDWDP
ncbi:MAG: IS3 family transposase, partial [Leptospirales bacterium]